MTPCVKGKKCFVGWRACEPCLCPRYLTGGYKSTGNSQKNIRKSFGYKGFTKFQRMSNGL
ncbi:conjugal transfer protein [Clostridioides difficile]|nr:conjugal transfer protein [Clostridioides difficile]MCI9970805.1 conjugal transfer protein [Clostridioides difficile]MCJ0185765.1 conjugal transfer protein [Clostridioides difficile]MCU5941379.1 conjugal transfer protein [Clostridioides difficile]MDB3276704.1 conjugal transfer protein [Clostridioides difficile]